LERLAIDPTLGHQQLGNLNSLAGGAPNRVVAQNHQAQIEHRTGPDPSYGNGHTASPLEVESRLWTVGLFLHFDGGTR
jgi:hypothetical protein